MSRGATPEAARQALRLANEVRAARTTRKWEIKRLSTEDGCAAVAALIADPPPDCAKAELGDVLRWIRKWGTRRIVLVLTRVQVSEQRALRDLTDRQRVGILEELAS